MNIIFRPYLDKFILIYLDDILIYGKTKDEHLNLNIVLDILKKYSLFARLSKYDFMRSNTRSSTKHETSTKLPWTLQLLQKICKILCNSGNSSYKSDTERSFFSQDTDPRDIILAS